MKKLLVLLMGVMLFSGCHERERLTLEDRITEKLELRQLCNNTTTQKESSSSGSFFLIAGSYSSRSSEKQVTKVSVFAKVDSTYRIIDFPIEKIRIRIDNSIKKPFLQIKYRAVCEVNTDKLLSDYWNDFEYIVTCPEAYLPEKLLPIDITN